jgi:hypothetical protein
MPMQMPSFSEELACSESFVTTSERFVPEKALASVPDRNAASQLSLQRDHASVLRRFFLLSPLR